MTPEGYRGVCFLFFSEDVPGLGSQSARRDGGWRGESGEGGLLGEDWVFLLAIDCFLRSFTREV